MATAGIGVDMLEIDRMERVLARRPNFVRRVFTEEERAYCDKCARPAEHYAARFAAREAVVKALGTGFSDGGELPRRLGHARRHGQTACPAHWSCRGGGSRAGDSGGCPLHLAHA